MVVLEFCCSFGKITYCQCDRSHHTCAQAHSSTQAANDRTCASSIPCLRSSAVHTHAQSHFTCTRAHFHRSASTDQKQLSKKKFANSFLHFVFIFCFLFLFFKKKKKRVNVSYGSVFCLKSEGKHEFSIW
jgi:hypothetical protein